MNQFALARAKVKNFRFKPNQTELQLLEFFDENFPGKIIFNGGQIIIEGMVGDFYCAKHYTFLEYVGRPDVPKHQPEALERRRLVFAKYGFRMMFIHQADLKDKELLCNNVLFFLHFGLAPA